MNTARKFQGFTLLEVLLAISITGFVLAGATSLIVAVSNIWTNRQSSHFFADHVDGIAEFLKASFAEAGKEIALSTGSDPEFENGSNRASPESESPPQDIQITVDRSALRPSTRSRTNEAAQRTQASGLLRTTEQPVSFARPPGFGSSEDLLLNFKLRNQPALLAHPDGAPTSGIDVFLHFDPEEGLQTLWYPLLQEEVENERDLFWTTLSPHVTQLIYVYWDDRFERWEEETEPRVDDNDSPIEPSYLKLFFEHQGTTAERIIRIPIPSRSTLVF